MKQVTNIFLEGEKAALIRKTWSKFAKYILKWDSKNFDIKRLST